MPLFTVVLTTYRRPDRLRTALESVDAQTDRDFEVVVMNNDLATAEEVDGVASLFDLPIKTVHNQENLGQSASRNHGVELAQTDVIALLDDDDTWHPTYLAKHRSRREIEPDLDLIYCGHYVVWSDIPLAPRACPASPPPEDLLQAMFRGDFTLAANSILTIKRESYLALGGYDPAMSGFPDWDFQVRLAQQGRFGHIPEPLVNFGFQLSGRDSDPDARFPELAVVREKWGGYPEVERFIRKARSHDLYRASFADVFRGQRARGLQHLWQYATLRGPGWDIGLLARLTLLNAFGPSAYTALQRRANAANR